MEPKLVQIERLEKGEVSISDQNTPVSFQKGIATAPHLGSESQNALKWKKKIFFFNQKILSKNQEMQQSQKHP